MLEVQGLFSIYSINVQPNILVQFGARRSSVNHQPCIWVYSEGEVVCHKKEEEIYHVVKYNDAG